ncbi:hypothetical protein [Streptococcus oralis]|jgi:hypothetical protein|uniref:hypothetical protein n=3 Tax=Streptococcus oralis TaxID=1303 RepID=UPI00228398A0|nr:hypothetical protein [Streptococcus oralis]MCY7088898.1 hypothetical protein [Streptococcus oralis]
MVINNINLVIPNDIQKGLESGVYKQFGSVIKNNKGQIIKHLKAVDFSKDTANKLIGNKAIKVGLIGAGVLAVGGVGYYGYRSIQMNSVSKSLIKRLTQYLITAQKGELTEKDIDKFLNFLNKNESLLKKLELDSSLDELFELVKTYTGQFAEVNNYVYHNEAKRKNNHNDKIINLKEYLKVQKNIYSSEVV